MYLFFFDVMTDGEVISDEEGMRLPNIDAAKREATYSLADLAKSAIRSTAGFRRMAILVRSSEGPLFQESFEWESSAVH
jgi:hypothetical protein